MSEKLELKPFDAGNQEILKKGWEYIRDIAENENGFTNNAFGISWEGFASQGLKLALEELKKLSADDQAILFVHKDNPASLRVMQKNGGSVVGETEENFKVQIKLL